MRTFRAPYAGEFLAAAPSRIFTASMAFAPDSGGSALPSPAPKDGPLTTPQASRDATDRPLAPPSQGLRRWASTRPVSRPSRQPATGPPGSYPDRTHTGRRRRAYEPWSPTRGHLRFRWAQERSRLGRLTVSLTRSSALDP